MTAPDPFAGALFLIAAFVLAGLAQTVWLGSPASRAFALPLDGGRTFRGRRIFGDNKTLRGFLVMVPAAGAAFVLLARLTEGTAGTAHGLWPLAPSGYWWLGVVAGIGFMAGELPNSFVKRQLGIAPGQAPPAGVARFVCFLADRVDSIVGMLTAVSLAVPLSVRTWGVVLVIGPTIHYLFSHLLFVVGVKARSA